MVMPKYTGLEEQFRCQNCNLPLQLDISLLDLSLSQRNLIVTSIGDQEDGGPLPTKHYFPKERLNKLRSVADNSEVNDKLKIGVLSDKFIERGSKVGADEITKQKSHGTDTITIQHDKSETQSIHEEKTLSTQVSTLSNIFNILSSKGSIDYPVCQDCCQLLIEKLKGEYAGTLQEKETYIQFLDRLKKQNSTQDVAETVLDRDVEKDDFQRDTIKELTQDEIENQRQQLFAKLIELEEEDASLDEELSDLTERVQIKKNQENELRERANIEELSELQFQTDLQNLKNQYEVALNSLDNLRKINIYNETFKISHSGLFGTINGLRLGSIHESRVSWREINAALGQVVLLLSLLSDRLHCPLVNYRLVPQGSFSKVLKYDTTNDSWTNLEAYYDENFKFTKLFHRETNFDKSLESILDVVKQLAKNILSPKQETIGEQLPSNNNNRGSIQADNIPSNSHNSIPLLANNSNNNNNNRASYNTKNINELPYSIFEEKINSLPVFLYGKEPDVKWTTAMKFLLTDIKWLLVLSTSNLSNAK